MRSPSNVEANAKMDSRTLDDRASVASDRNYMNAHRYLGALQMRIRELTENPTRDATQLESLQQKVIDIKEVFALIERELDGVEDEDWHPRLKLPPRLIEPEAPPRTASAPPEDVRPKESRRPSGYDDPRASVSNASSRYRPSEDYRPSPPPEALQHGRSPQPSPIPKGPSPVPRAPSPPPAVAFATIPDPRSGLQPAGGARSPIPQRGSRDSQPPAPSVAPVPQKLPPLPSNMKFDHGPLFTECIASLKLSHYVFDAAEAREDLADDKEKLRKAEEANDAAKVQKYKKRITQDEEDIREYDQDHWKKEVNPLRQAYSVEILRCLQQLDLAIKYTEGLADQGRLEADAISDMRQLKEWLNKCLNQPKTWRKDDRLLVGLIEGYPRKLREASYVKDLLEEAAPTPKKKDDIPSKEANSSRKQDEDDRDNSNSKGSKSSSSSTTKPIAINADLLEGLLNGAIPKEVAANITQCPECNGTGGDLEHAKICSECEGKGSHPDSHDAIELCPKCNGRGFALSKKYRCPVCDAYKIVMNVPADTPDPRQSRDRDQPPAPADGAGLQRSDSKRRKASFAPEPIPAPDEGPQRRSSTSSKKDRDRDRDREREYSPDGGGGGRYSDPEEDHSSRRKSKSGASSSSSSRRHRDRDRERDPSDSRSPSPVDRSSGRNRRSSQSQSQSTRGGGGGGKDEAPDPSAGLTGLIGAIAGAASEPGSWTGKKGKKILEAALAAGAGGLVGGGGGGGGGGGAGSDDERRSESDRDDGKRHRKRRGSRY